MLPTITGSIRATALRTSGLPVRRATPVLARFYHEKVLDHYNRPRNVGSLPKNDIDVGTGLYPLFFSPLTNLLQCWRTGMWRRNETTDSSG